MKEKIKEESNEQRKRIIKENKQIIKMKKLMIKNGRIKGKWKKKKVWAKWRKKLTKERR